MLFKKVINKYVPIRLLPRRYNVEQQFRWVFERVTGQSLEQAFDLFGVERAQVRKSLNTVDRELGKLMLEGNQEGFEPAMRLAIASLLDALVQHGNAPSECREKYELLSKELRG